MVHMKNIAIKELKEFIEKKKPIPSPLWFHGIYREVNELESRLEEAEDIFLHLIGKDPNDLSRVMAYMMKNMNQKHGK